MRTKDTIEAGKKLRQKVHELEETFDITLTEEAKYAALVPYCCSLLTAFGFRCVPKLSYRYDSITKVDELIDYFYIRFKYLYPDKIVPARDLKRDRGIIKRFIDARINASGIKKSEAIVECAEIIDTILSNARNFELVFVIGLRMFGQQDMLWATEKAVGIMNKKRLHVIPEYIENLIEKANETYDGPHGMLYLLDEENNNGKEER